MTEETYTVKGIHCQSCVVNISETVGAVDGVTAVEVDRDGEKVLVRGDSFQDTAVRDAIAATGYAAL